MYSTGKERACPRCTSLLDQFQSLKLHVQASGLMTFGIIAKGEYESLIPAVESNNWIWDVYSASGNSFPEDVGVTKGGGLAGAEGMYDYVKPWPGVQKGRRISPEFPSSSEMLMDKSTTPIRCLERLFSNWFNTFHV
jgi:predicted dithiol-disulfide oxidoreductase (DUF899 family)